MSDTAKYLPVLPQSAKLSHGHVKEFAPDLLPLYWALIPFDDVIGSWMAGPQPQAKDYDPDEEPHIYFSVEDPSFPNSRWNFTMTRHSITFFREMDGGADPEVSTTLDQVFNFLRQMPRPMESFGLGDIDTGGTSH